MRVLLTGAAGFIGSHVARQLIQEGCEVYALVRNESDLWRIEDILSQLHLVYGDLLNSNQIQTQLEAIQPELCVHVAWYVVPEDYLSAIENVDMLRASLMLASQLAEIGCHRFIGVGTCIEYDVNLGYLSEQSPVKPTTLYGATKLATQIGLTQLTQQFKEMTVAWVRLFYQYGPFERKQRLIPYVIRSLLQNQTAEITSGDQIKDYLYVEDVASAIWAVAQSEVSGPINVASGHPMLLRDFINKIAEQLNRTDLVRLVSRPPSIHKSHLVVANVKRLRNEVGWHPTYTLDSGLEKTIAWWKAKLGPI